MGLEANSSTHSTHPRSPVGVQGFVKGLSSLDTKPLELYPTVKLEPGLHPPSPPLPPQQQPQHPLPLQGTGGLRDYLWPLAGFAAVESYDMTKLRMFCPVL